MNIDTLKNTDGTFRKARTIDITRCLNAGYTTHLQTERGTMSFRPFSDGTMMVSRCLPGKHSQDKIFECHDTKAAERIVRAAMLFLNGERHPYKPNDDFSVYANQAERDGYVLAVIGDELLVEYTMPNGTSALRLVRVLGTRMTGSYKAFSYNAVPKKWLDAIFDAGMTDWIGMGQRSATRIPFPNI